MSINLKELFGKKEQPVDLMATPTGQGSGGKRVNGLPSLIVVFFVLLAVGGIAYVTHLRSQNKIVPGATQPLDQKKEGRSASQMANEATSKWLSGIIPSDAQPGRGLPDMPDVQETKKTNEKEPAANTFSNANAKFSVPVDPYFEDRIRIRERRTQALEAALQSKVGIQMSELRSRQTTARDVTAQLADTRQRIASMGDPTSAYQSRLTQQNGPSGTDGLYRSAATGKNDVRQFEQTDSWNLDSQVQAPASPYMLRTGFVIPATMISGINSDLLGQVMAQVSQNVWDTATGRFLLIPQGTRLIGAYSSDVAYGQERVLMAWQRLIFPDGKVLDIHAMPGADSAGYAGFADKVNNHWFRTISSAVLMSGVIAAADMSQNDGNSNSNNDRQRASDALSEALGQTLGQIISKNLNVAPTLEIRPGYRFNVMVIKDMTLPGPYQAFAY
ncbi:TrbI/VirB10 family protein [Bilophila wadsworthia]|uniref:TrbI/VirB10 family protein n=1 Tax=Bilophila wadsworthia TaxID=35833 RepID=UPI00267468C5|nr:TrbI/VirB10 family protein [Bilophila wadsworthia]